MKGTIYGNRLPRGT